MEEKAKLATEILQAQFGEHIEEDPSILMPMEFDAAIRRALNTKKPHLNQMHSFIILHIQVLHLLFMSSPRTSYQLRPLHRGTRDIPTASREHSLSGHVPGFTEAVWWGSALTCGRQRKMIWGAWLLSMEMSTAIRSCVKPSCMWRDR
jgi:hypothetical protein